MNDIKIKLTTAGMAALVDENNIGTNALKITTLELGSSFYTPSGNETDLVSLVKSLNTFGGAPADNGIIHISIRDESNDIYDLGEIGLRTGTGILLGIVSSEDGLITTKGEGDTLLIAADLTFTDGDISNITFGEANFIYQPGTEEKAGIFELATGDETDNAAPGKVIDAKNFQEGISRRSSSSTELDDETKLATSAAIFALSQSIAAHTTTLQSINTLLQSDDANIDTLQEAADLIKAIQGTQNTLAIGNIAGLQTALSGKSDTHSHPFAASVHNHDNVYGGIENTGIGRMIFGRFYSSHQADDPIPTVQYGQKVNLSANPNFDIRAYALTSSGSAFEGAVNTRETTGVWQCLGYAPTIGFTMTMWRCVG